LGQASHAGDPGVDAEKIAGAAAFFANNLPEEDDELDEQG
jgi:hypothetical protein